MSDLDLPLSMTPKPTSGAPIARLELQRAESKVLSILNETSDIAATDLSEPAGSSESGRQLNSLLRDFGLLLQVWLEIVSASESLQRCGFSLCRAL